jgi:hypothetical protein
MSNEIENKPDILTNDTRQQLKDLSKSMLRLHKTLLEAEKADYESLNGRIPNVNTYFQLVLDHPQFAWLRKFSSLIALIDEAVSLRRPATETESRGLLNEARILLNFQDLDEDFNDKFQAALQENSDAVLNYNDAVNLLK